ATLETAIINAANNDATLKAAGITATSDNGLSFVSANGTPVQVQVGGDTLNTLGFGNFVNATPATSVTAGSAYAADTDGPLAGTLTFDVSVGGGASSRITVATNALGAAGGDSEATLIGLINAQIALENGTSAWTKAGVTAKDNGGSIEFASSNGTQFQLGVGNDATQTGTAGFAATQDGTARSAGVTAYTGLTAGNATFVNEDSGGAYQLGTTAADGTTSATALAFAPIVYGNDQQVLTLSAADANGQNHSVLINLDADTAGSIDQAVNSINQQIHAGGDSTTQQIYAVAVQNSGAAQIEFESNVKDFSVNVGATTNGTGVGDPSTQQGTTLSSVKVGSGGAIDISTVSDAQAAVTAITNAVNVLGTAQAAVGKGENQLNYAISLAQSQITNFSSAESNIRDANVAQQAANLTKAQVLQQASIAAMAQANSAPQAILTLLRG
ncbi:MAG TPA: flagellin, partial [Bryobacteraceae bacterium]|nr:flagellin [Bryobacteraceae bacterium]